MTSIRKPLSSISRELFTRPAASQKPKAVEENFDPSSQSPTISETQKPKIVKPQKPKITKAQNRDLPLKDRAHFNLPVDMLTELHQIQGELRTITRKKIKKSDVVNASLALAFEEFRREGSKSTLLQKL
jgi:hypothetical protein